MHEFLEMIIIAICTVIGGADRWTEVEAFGQAKFAWLSTFLALPGRIAPTTHWGGCFGTWIPRSLRPVSGSGLRGYSNGSRRFCTISPSTCCARMLRRASVSTASVSRLAGTPTTSPGSSFLKCGRLVAW